MAGWPVKLQTGVKGLKNAMRFHPANGSCVVEPKELRGKGGSASVGVSQTTWFPKNLANSRAVRCSTFTARRESDALYLVSVEYMAQVSGSNCS